MYAIRSYYEVCINTTNPTTTKVAIVYRNKVIKNPISYFHLSTSQNTKNLTLLFFIDPQLFGMILNDPTI